MSSRGGISFFFGLRILLAVVDSRFDIVADRQFECSSCKGTGANDDPEFQVGYLVAGDHEPQVSMFCTES